VLQRIQTSTETEAVFTDANGRDSPPAAFGWISSRRVNAVNAVRW